MLIDTITNIKLNGMPESLHAEKHEEVVIDFNRSWAFLFRNDNMSRFKRTVAPLCACGCGERVKWNKYEKRWNEFIAGHQNRKENNPMHGKIGIYSPSFGLRRSNETKRKMSNSAKKRHAKEGNVSGGIVNRPHTIWNKHHPESPIIPGDGNVIHHKDENHYNDDPNNLEKIPQSKHISLHHKGKVFSEEIKKKFSDAHKGQIPWCTGKKLTLEHRKNLSESHKGNPGYWTGKVGPMKGRKHKEETKRKISESVKRKHAERKKNDPYSKN